MFKIILKIVVIFFFVAVFIFIGLSFLNKYERVPKTEEYENLIGKWKVVHSTFIPFEHISFCKELELNSIFQFSKYGVLRIFESDNTRRNCNQFQNFWISGKELVVFEYDVPFSYEILKLSSDTLQLKNKRIPHGLLEKMEPQSIEIFGEDKIKYITENGNVITLVKQKLKR